MNIDFTGKTALITGATRGIGKSIADCLYEAGASLILTGTNDEEIESLNLYNKKQNILNVLYLQVDFSDALSVKKFLNKLDEFVRIDICVNNVGVNRVSDFLETSLNDFNWIDDINLKAPYQILKIVGQKMVANKYGRIVNIASIWSVINRNGRSMYSTSKSALVGLTKSLAVEWGEKNVMVNAVSPGFTLTKLTKDTNTPEQIELIENSIPLRRMAETAEIARVIAFLSSDLNTYLTGQNIIVDGGYTNV